MSLPITPTTQREARLWNFYNRGEYFFSIQAWPEWVKKLALSDHLKNNEAYNFYYFLVGNGLDPNTAAIWVGMSDTALSSVARIDNYQLQYMNKKAWKHTLLTGNKKVYDMIEGRPVMM